MGKLRGFLEFNRVEEEKLSVKNRIKNYKEFTIKLQANELEKQGARCMDCGVPFCHSGCPLGNLIPDFNDAVYKNEWRKALDILHATNNFPEFTGRLCPAPCESACVLGINNPPVAIELIEKNIIERGFSENWVTPKIPQKRTDKKIAIVGSGPSGLAAAEQLNKAGHLVTVFERALKPGGLLRYGIPDFKLEKHIIDRRIDCLEKAGIVFKCNVEIGKDLDTATLENDFDAIVLCIGATIPRKLDIPGSDLKGVEVAMNFLSHNNKVIDGLEKRKESLFAKNKNVIVIGGGDTGSDCIGTSRRQGAKTITNFELTAKLPVYRTDAHPWPYWPFTFKTTTSHEEGCDREWNILTKEFIGDDNGNLIAIKTIDVEQINKEGERPSFKEIEGSEKEWLCDLALLALGFTGPEQSLAEKFDIKLNQRGNILTNKNYQTSKSNIFAAGDSRRGQSLIVWCISEGREVAYQIDKFLMGKSDLAQKSPATDLTA